MAGGFFDNTTGGSFSHNHTPVAGDGGVLVNLGVTGTILATGTITSSLGNIVATAGTMSEGVEATAATQLPTLQGALALELIGL